MALPSAFDVRCTVWREFDSHGRRSAVKPSDSTLLVLTLLLGLLFSPPMLAAQGARPVPIGVRQLDQAQGRFDKDSIPPLGHRPAIDPQNPKHDADELPALAEAVPSEVAQTSNGALPKDL